MILNSLSPHHHHPWRPSPGRGEHSPSETPPPDTPLRQRQSHCRAVRPAPPSPPGLGLKADTGDVLVPSTPCPQASYLHTQGLLKATQSSRPWALPFSTKGIILGGDGRDIQSPRQLPVCPSPCPGKSLGLGRGTTAFWNERMLSEHFCFHR